MRTPQRPQARSRLIVASVLGLGVVSCGSESGMLSAPPSSMYLESVPESRPASSYNLGTNTAVTIESVATAEEQEHFRLEVDEMSITLLPPNDARPDPVNVLRPGGSVLAAERWMTDCCWMSLVVQDQRPLFPDDMLADTVSIGHISWDVYDLTKRDFVAIEAVTTTDKVSISVAAQVRFPAETPAETAYNLVDQVIKTMAIQPK